MITQEALMRREDDEHKARDEYYQRNEGSLAGVEAFLEEKFAGKDLFNDAERAELDRLTSQETGRVQREAAAAAAITAKSPKFTPAQIGKMTRQELDALDPSVMTADQLRAASARNSALARGR
jgi:hypothetical protein